MCTGDCNDSPSIRHIIGQAGSDGNDGWSPECSLVSDGERRVLQIVSWMGGEGTPPSSTNQYIGSTGIVEDISLAVDIRGATGATGATGSDGDTGWAPVLAVVTDGDRRVLQIVDWQGGSGTKPSITSQYIGAVGIVSTAGAAVDIRGATGATGANGSDGSDITDGRVKISSADTTINYVEDKLVEGDNISITKNNPTGNESITIEVSNTINSYNTTLTSSGGAGSLSITVYYFKVGRMVCLFVDLNIPASTFSAAADYYSFPLPHTQVGFYPNWALGSLIHNGTLPTSAIENILLEAIAGNLRIYPAEWSSGSQLDDFSVNQRLVGQIFYEC